MTSSWELNHCAWVPCAFLSFYMHLPQTIYFDSLVRLPTMVILNVFLSNSIITLSRSGIFLMKTFYISSPSKAMHLLQIFIDGILKYWQGSLQWRHNDRDSVSNHQPHHCLLNRLFRRRSKKTSKLSVTGLCVGNSQGTGEFPAQMASNAENVSIWWRHHVAIAHWGPNRMANILLTTFSNAFCEMMVLLHDSYFAEIYCWSLPA